MFDVERIIRSFTGVQRCAQWSRQMKKGRKLWSLQPFNPLSGAYRSRTDDLLTASQTL